MSFLDELGRLFGGGKKASFPTFNDTGGGWQIPIDGGPMPIPGMGKQSNPAPSRPEHKGMFGIKGTFRDILGVLGDSLNRGDPIYSNQRRNEKYSDAMAGFGENPLAAIQKAYGVDRNQAAEDWDTYQDNERERQKLLGQTQRDDRKEGREAIDHEYNILDRAGRLMNPSVVNKENWGATKDLYLKVLARNKIAPPVDLPDEYDPEIAKRLFNGAIEADDQVRIETQGRNADLAEARLRELEGNNAFNRRDKAIKTASTTAATAVGAYATADKVANPEKYRGSGKTGRAAPSIGRPPRPPSRRGETATSPNGDVWISRNGKTWVKP